MAGISPFLIDRGPGLVTLAGRAGVSPVSLGLTENPGTASDRGSSVTYDGQRFGRAEAGRVKFSGSRERVWGAKACLPKPR